jgi:hypothetical protein
VGGLTFAVRPLSEDRDVAALTANSYQEARVAPSSRLGGDREPGDDEAAAETRQVHRSVGLSTHNLALPLARPCELTLTPLPRINSKLALLN